MNYKNYQQARDAAWRILIDCKISKMPVNVSAVCKNYGFSLLNYHQGKRVIDFFHLQKQTMKSDGFTVCHKNKFYIFYNELRGVERCRFTIAHELGHIFLGHLQNNQVTSINREPDPADTEEEHMANIFASRLLAPACVLHELRIKTPKDISALCGISLQSAEFRASRMQILNARDAYYRSDLELQVRDQLDLFIKDRLSAHTL